MRTSIIIPTFNEESCLGETLRRLRDERPHEILVADGGSTDRTCEIAAAADRLLHAPRGRAHVAALRCIPQLPHVTVGSPSV